MHLLFSLLTIGIAIGLFFTMLLFLEVGRRIGVSRLDKPGARAGVGIVDGSTYALLALLISFTFSGAAGRFDQRRQLIADTVNMAGTAWQRIEMLPAAQQLPIRDSFRRYVDALIAWYGEKTGTSDPLHEPTEVTNAQNTLWTQSVAVCLTADGEKARMLLLPSLNEFFGSVEKERAARRIHPPMVIFAMLGIMALAGSLFVGYAIATNATRNWIYMIGIAATISMAVYVILELEYPRLGVFRATAMDQTLVELRATWE
jgi:hypothetical protein